MLRYSAMIDKYTFLKVCTDVFYIGTIYISTTPVLVVCYYKGLVTKVELSANPRKICQYFKYIYVWTSATK